MSGTQVAVIGTGLLGQGIAAVVRRHGFSLVLHDASTDALTRAVEQLGAIGAPSGITLRGDSTLEGAVADADFVIEAVAENLELKQKLFARMAAANGHAILMSNSSVLPIGQIAAKALRPERTVGTHWWNPPQLIPVVEVIRGPHTDGTVMQRAADFLRQLGKRPVPVERDVPGFVGNRLQHALWREAIGMVSAGVCTAVEVDRLIAATLGVSLALQGPLAQINQRGLATVADDFSRTLSSLVNEPAPAQLLREKVAAGQLGAKTGQGFLPWPPGARERAAAKLTQHVESRLRSGVPDGHATCALPEGQAIPDGQRQLAMRLRVALWREAIAMVADGVCDAATVDLMACNTIGLRLAVMAPLENADYVGLDLTLAIHESILPSLNSSIELPSMLSDKAARGESF